MNAALPLIGLIIIPLELYAESQKSFDDTLQELSKDLASLHAEVQEATKQQTFAAAAAEVWNAKAATDVTVSKHETKIFTGANSNAAVLTKATQGESFPVVDKVGDWYAVALPNPELIADMKKNPALIADLKGGWISASDVVPERKPVSASTAPSTSSGAEIYNKILEKIKAIRDTYENNPYVSVSGFSINLGIPPSVDISFEFRKAVSP